MMPAHWRFVRSGKAAIRDGEREIHELSRLVVPGTVAIDVGAHIGDYTYSLCHCVGPHGHVIAIEPQPGLARLLERAGRRLRLPLTVIPCALSDSDGTQELNTPPKRPASGLSTLEHRAAWDHQVVKTSKLDTICSSQQETISFIKIDVEGHELAVLRGGEQTLRRHRPNLLVEIEQRHSPVDICQTFDFLLSLGYRGEFLDTNRMLRPLAEFAPEKHQVCNGDGLPSLQYISNFIFCPAANGGTPSTRGDRCFHHNYSE